MVSQHEKFILDTNGNQWEKKLRRKIVKKNCENESLSNSWPKEPIITLFKHRIGSVEYTGLIFWTKTNQNDRNSSKSIKFMFFFLQKIPILSISNFELIFKESQSTDGIKCSDWRAIDLLFHSMVDDHRLMPLIWSSKAAIVMNILISNWFHLHLVFLFVAAVVVVVIIIYWNSKLIEFIDQLPRIECLLNGGH